jgi:maleate isomerase
MQLRDVGMESMRKLGIIWPGEDLQRSEWARLESRLAAGGAAGVAIAYAASSSDGSHALDSLEATAHIASLDGAARQLRQAGCDAVVWACTSGSFIGGYAAAVAQAEALSVLCAAPATSTSLAIVEAARHLGTAKVDILSPYPKGATERFSAFIRAAGLEIGRLEILDCDDAATSRGIDLRRSVMPFVENDKGTDPLIIPDTAIDSLDLLEGLESVLGRPVITANQASLWHGLRLADYPTSALKHAGRLFSAADTEPAPC